MQYRMTLRGVIFFVLSVAFVQSSHARDTLVGRVVANGGVTRSEGGDHVLSATIGEPVAGPSVAGDLQLDAGFWQPARVPAASVIFNDDFED